MLRTFKFYGQMAELFGAVHRLEVQTLGEMVRALSVQLKGFKKYIEKHDFEVTYEGKKGGVAFDDSQLHFNLPVGVIHFTPHLAGAKSGGLGKIIAGILLVAVAFFVPFAIGASAGLSTTIFGSFTYGNLAVMGAGLIATGVSQLLNKPQKPKKNKDDSSFMLDGTLNVTSQGGPVPVIYGRIMTGSVLISAALYTYNYGASNTKAPSSAQIGFITGTGAKLGAAVTPTAPTKLARLGAIGWTTDITR